MQEGFTASERYLNNLCRRAFLSLWSYNNIFKNQAASGVDGKEICDLLVVCGNNIVIFSDKACEFKKTENPDTDWCRWFKKAVIKSARQIWGAERWLLNYPDRVFLDRSCTSRFPLDLPSKEKAVVHRIVVAHGSATRAREEFGGGSGSLTIAPTIQGPEHINPESDVYCRFAVGDLDRGKGFVHVLDDFSLDVVLKTLDTITDFLEYLEKRALFIRSRKLLWAAGEEDLLAYYLANIDTSKKHYFKVPRKSQIVIDERWEAFQRHPDWLAKIEADEISYGWDTLIEKFNHHATAGTMRASNWESLSEFEQGIRFMSRECRTRRRLLFKQFAGILGQETKDIAIRTSFAPKEEPGLPLYIFLSAPVPQDRTLEKYREHRREYLYTYCLRAKANFPHVQHIIGIASEPLNWPNDERTEDMIHLDVPGNRLPDEAEADLSERLRLLQIAPSVTAPERRTVEFEYPLRRGQEMRKGRNRNIACPCGSGKKFKKCCM